MHYFTFDLNAKSQELCMIIKLFGKYKYICIPMCLECATDVQQIIEQVLCGLNNIEVYLDDIGVLGNTWEDH